MQKIVFNGETNSLLISYNSADGITIQVLKQVEGEQDEVLEAETQAAVSDLNDFIKILKVKYDK